MRPPDPSQKFIQGTHHTAVGAVPRVSTRLTRADALGHWRARWRIRRNAYRVDPGLYAVGSPDAGSPVLVTANFKLTFDVLRSHLKSGGAWVLVLDTHGINVWCAAGKGTFSTAELIARVRFCRLDELVSHHRLILPQLGAVGVAAHEVRRATGFTVVYGPVRAADLPAFLASGLKATPEMRQPTFTFRERLVLTPAELAGALKPTLWFLALLALVVLFSRPLASGTVTSRFLRYAVPYTIAVLGGTVITPVLLPWLPFRAFAAKGALVGLVLGGVMLAAAHFAGLTLAGRWNAIAIAILMAGLSSFLAMNFTGSTPFTSMSGVEHEMRRWIPAQAIAAGAAALLMIAGAFLR